MASRRDQGAAPAIVELTAILAVWAAAVAAAAPRGNFPLNDDWDFAIATWNFARSGEFQFTAHTAVSLRAQVVWGALWTRLFGESFEVLRMSTLALAAVAIVIVHRILARAGAAPAWRILGTLAFAFHPIFFWSSATYMTEIPFVCASAAALYCFVRGFDEDRFRWTLAGCAAASLSAFVRQTGVLNLVAPLALALWRRRWRDAAAYGGTMAMWAALLLFRREWVAGAPAEFAVHYRAWKESSFRLPQQIELAYHWFVFNAQNIGLFLMPLVIAAAFVRWRRRELLIAGAAAVLLFARVQSLISLGHPMPYFVAMFCCDIYAGNILVDLGLGPHALRGTYPLALTGAARLLLTYASVVLGALLIATLARRQTDESSARWLATGTALAGTLGLVASALYVDRYALDSAWSLAVALPLLAPRISRAAKAAAAVALIAIASFDVVAVRDYFSWNRARWDAFHALRAQGVPVTDIDGGAEIFNFYELSKGDQRMRRIHMFGVPPRRYTISYSPLPGKRVVARYPWRHGEILVSETSD